MQSARNIRKRLGLWAVIVLVVLLIPLAARWPWTWNDYCFGAVMLFGSAVTYELATRKSDKKRRIAVGALVFMCLASFWVTLATG
jgi:polyferredoxin